MKIDKMKLKTPKNPNIFLVAVGDDEYIFHSDIIVKFGLTINEEIDKEKFFEALKESEYIICLNKSMEYISNRLKTVKQLKDYLYKKGYKSDTIKKVVEKLNEYSLVNDTNFASSFIEANKNRLSKKSLQNKLQEKGIKKEDFLDFLDELKDDEVCEKMAVKFLKNKEISKQNIEKLIRHLQYKGFGWDSISSVLRKLKLED